MLYLVFHHNQEGDNMFDKGTKFLVIFEGNHEEAEIAMETVTEQLQEEGYSVTVFKQVGA